jgi:uroporphyrinogen-III decarboxylase
VAHRHFSLATQRSLTVIWNYVSLSVDQIGVGGDFSGTNLLISPEAYREFIVPEVRTLSQRIHEADRYAVNASDGNLWPVIDDFLFECEVDGYIEIDLHAGMDLAELKDICRNRITLYGNLDCGNILSFGSRAAVRRHTIGCIEAGMGDGGHILCASNAVTASVPLENYLTVVNTYRDFFGLARFRREE